MANSRESKSHPDYANDAIGATAREGVADVKEEFDHLRAKLRSNGAQLEDELRDAGARFSDGAKKLAEATAAQVREHPMAAFGIAFAAGLIVSRWLRAR